MEREEVRLDALDARRAELAGEGKTPVRVAVDGRAVGLLAIADAPRPTSKRSVARGVADHHGCQVNSAQSLIFENGR